MAEARTTLFSSFFMSATVWLTVASKVASSMALMPWLACPRATRPARLKMSEKNPIFSLSLTLCLGGLCLVARSSPLLNILPYQFAGGQDVGQHEAYAGQDVVAVVG